MSRLNTVVFITRASYSGYYVALPRLKRRFDSARSLHRNSYEHVLGRLAQLVRATGLHPVGRGFDSLSAHQCQNKLTAFTIFVKIVSASRYSSSADKINRFCLGPKKSADFFGRGGIAKG